MTSQMGRAIDLYYASAVLLATTLCLLTFQDIGDLPSNTQNAEVDLPVLANPAQSLSQ